MIIPSEESLPTESELLLQSEFAAERLRSDIVSGSMVAWHKVENARVVAPVRRRSEPHA